MILKIKLLVLLFLSLHVQVYAQKVGSISFLNGNAFVERGIKSLPATLYMTLHGGDILQTSAQAEVTVKLENGNVLKIHKKTKFLLPEPDRLKTGIMLHFGRLFAKVKKLVQGEKFEIRTPTASAGVRGTEFEVAFDPMKKVTETSVFEGSVFSKNFMGDMKILEQGMTSRITEEIFETVENEMKILEKTLESIKIPLDHSKKSVNEALNGVQSINGQVKKMLEDMNVQERLMNESILKKGMEFEKGLNDYLKKLEKELLKQGKMIEKEAEQMATEAMRAGESAEKAGMEAGKKAEKMGENIGREAEKLGESIENSVREQLKGLNNLFDDEDDDDDDEEDDDDDW